MYIRLRLSKSLCKSGCATHTLLPCFICVCKHCMLFRVKVNPRACHTAVYGVCRCVRACSYVLITGAVWFRALCVCVRTANRVSDRLSFHEAIGMNEPVDPRFSRGHAPSRTHARTPLCLVLIEPCCVFPFVSVWRCFF